MIHYEQRSFISKILQWRGSVFPKSIWVALPCGVISAVLKLLIEYGILERFLDPDHYGVISDNGAWSGFAFLVGFLIVFRTSQSYNRFWDGSIHTYSMHAEWFDACSNLVAFCVQSKAPEDVTTDFKHLMVRMFSLLHVLALAEIEDSCKDDIRKVNAFRMELIDVHGIDPYTLTRIKESDSKVELVFTWIQQLIVANISTGIMAIPPPILSRVFQELSNGMVAFDQAMKITLIPFPFPYAQTCDCLMMIHWLVMPLIVAQWATHPFWAFVLTFIQVFILWSLNFIAVELENPFGRDENDLDGTHLQMAFNRHLTMLIRSDEDTLPTLRPTALKTVQEIMCTKMRQSSTLASAWLDLSDEDSVPMRSAKRRDEKLSLHKAMRRVISKDKIPNSKATQEPSQVGLLQEAGGRRAASKERSPSKDSAASKARSPSKEAPARQMAVPAQQEKPVAADRLLVASAPSPLDAPYERAAEARAGPALALGAPPLSCGYNGPQWEVPKERACEAVTKQAPAQGVPPQQNGFGAVRFGGSPFDSEEALAKLAPARGLSPPPRGDDATNMAPTVFGVWSRAPNFSPSLPPAPFPPGGGHSAQARPPAAPAFPPPYVHPDAVAC